MSTDDASSSDYREVYLRDYPLALAKLGRGDKLSKLITSMRFLDQKLRFFGLDSILDDVDHGVQLAPKDDVEGYRALADALRLARPALEADASQLPSQIAARLMKTKGRWLEQLVGEARIAGQSGILTTGSALAQGPHSSTELIQLEGGLECLAVTRDGKWLVTGGKDGMVSTWSLPFRGNSRVHKFAVQYLTALCPTEDGRFILIGDKNGNVAKWDPAKGFREATCSCSDDPVLELTLVGTHHVAALFRFGVVCVLELESLRKVQGYQIELAQHICCPSEDRLLTGSGDGFIDSYAPLTGQRGAVVGWHGAFKKHRMSEQEFFVRSMAALPNLVVSSGPDDVRKLDVTEGIKNLNIPEIQKCAFLEEMKEDPFKDLVECICSDVDGTPLALSGCMNGELALLDLADGKVARRFQHSGGESVRGCALSSKHRLALAGHFGGAIRLWNSETGAELGALVESGETPTSLALVPGSTEVIAGFESGRLQVWRDPLRSAAEPEKQSREPIRLMSAICGRGWGISKSTIRCYSSDGDSEIRKLDFSDRGGGKMSLSADRRRVLTHNDNRLVISDIATGWVITSFEIEKTSIGPETNKETAKLHLAGATPDMKRIILFSFGGLLTATTGNYSRLELRDHSGALLRVLDERAGLLEDLTVSPDGRWAATCGFKTVEPNVTRSELRLWSMSSGECIWEQVVEGVSAMAFSADGEFLWYKAGTDLQCRRTVPDSKPEPIARIPSPWQSFEIADGCLVGVGHNTIEIWDTADGRKVGAFSLDATVSAFCIAGNQVVVGDALGRIHALVCARLKKSAGDGQSVRPYKFDDAHFDVLAALDAAESYDAAGKSSEMIQVWYEISASKSARPELRLSIAAQFKRIGYPEESAALCAGIALDRNVPVSIRLQAVSDIPSENLVAVLRPLAAGMKDSQILDTSNPDRQILCCVLERMVNSGLQTHLAKVAQDAGLSELARAAISHGLARLDKDFAIALLSQFATKARNRRARLLAMEGLRHLLSALPWLDTLAASSPSDSDEEFRATVSRMVLLKTRIATSIIFYEKDIPWYDLGLLTSYLEVNNQAMACTQAGKIEQALDLLQRGSRIFPDDARMHLNRGGLLIRQKRYEEAVQEATKCLELDPHYEKAFNFRAYARIKLGQHELALEDLNRALEMNPHDYANLKNRAGCYESLGRIAEAEADWNEVQRIKAQLGEDDPAPFEASARPSAASQEEEITEEAIGKAVAFLTQSGLLPMAIAWVNQIAVNAGMALAFRADAIHGLGELRAEDELFSLMKSAAAHPQMRIVAAATLWRLDPEAARRTIFTNKHKKALHYLTNLVTDPDANLMERHTATHELLQSFDPDEIEKLARSIRDVGSKDGEALPGVQVALVLIKSLGPKHEFSRLEALATSRDANGWLRELASQTLGVYVDRSKARELSTAHLLEMPSDSELVAAIKQALGTYGQDQGPPSFSPDPIMEGVFLKLVDLPSLEGLEELNATCTFLTDPEFIRQVESYLKAHPAFSESKNLRAKVAALKKLSPNPLQIALREFMRCQSPKEMRDAAERVPQLTQPGFQRWLEKLIRETAPKDEQPAFLKRLEWLRGIPQNQDQYALLEFAKTHTVDEVRQLVARFPFMLSQRFRRFAARVQLVGAAPPNFMEERLQWLASLGPAQEDSVKDEIVEALKAGRSEVASRKLEELQNLAPEAAESILACIVLHHNGEFQEAADCFTKVIERNPTDMAYEGRGRTLMSLRRPLEAINDFTKALELSPDLMEALLGRGLAFSEIQNWKASATDLERALQLSDQTKDELIVFALAGAYMRTGENVRARKLLLDFPQWSGEFEPRVRELISYLEKPQQEQDPGRAALESLRDASDSATIQRVVEVHPIFWHPPFQAALERHIDSLSDGPDRSQLTQNYEKVLQIVRNPGQLAFEALMRAEDWVAMRQAVESHPLLRDRRFLTHLRQMGQSMDIASSKRLAAQLELHAHVPLERSSEL